MPAAQSEPEPENQTETIDEEAPANPLEAVRRAQAKRSLPPGSHPQFHGGNGRGGGGKQQRMYNRHK